MRHILRILPLEVMAIPEMGIGLMALQVWSPLLLFLRGMHLLCFYRFIAMLFCSLISSFFMREELFVFVKRKQKRSVNTDLFGKWWR